MKQIGYKIFYDSANGNVILTKGEMQGVVTEETIDGIILKYTALSERNRDTFDFIELPYGAYQQDFAECNGYRVNPETLELEFSYPDPSEPEAPPVFVKPLTEQIEELKTKQFETNQVLAESSAAQQDLLELLIDMGVI